MGEYVKKSLCLIQITLVIYCSLCVNAAFNHLSSLLRASQGGPDKSLSMVIVP